MMKKRNVMFLSLFLFSLFLVPSFASAQWEVPVLSPEYSGTEVVYGPWVDFLKGPFTSWGEGDVGPNVAKIVLLLLLTVFLYAITDFLPFFPKGKHGIKWMFSVLVAFLATAYLTPGEIYAQMMLYGALGFTLGAVIPLAIIIFFSVEVGRDPTPGSIILQYFMWVAFAGFLIYRIITGIIEAGVEPNSILFWFEVVVLLFAIVIIAKNKAIRKWLFRTDLGLKKEKAERKQDVIEAGEELSERKAKKQLGEEE
tara:strand:+ start:2032 stop:2793 length:762 start_codon:yes stop_codon:yes gene_type:complete